jgi:parvulin-like peptidyl-prolyl cis-trans isomerase-like protein
MNRSQAVGLKGGLLVVAFCIVGCANEPPSAPEPDATALPEATTAPTSRPVEGPRPIESRLPGPTQGRIVAAGLMQVHDRFVTLEQVLRQGRTRFAALPTDVSEEIFRARALPIIRDETREQIRFQLLLVEAERGLREEQRDIVDQEVKNTREKMLTRAGGSEARLRKALAQEGRTLDEALTDQREWLMVRIYLRRKLTPATTITRKMLWDYYQANRAAFEHGRRVRLRIMAVPFGALPPASQGDESPPADRARALLEGAEKALQDGADFAAEAARLVDTLRTAHGEAWEELSYSGRVYVMRMGSEGGLWPEFSPEGFRDPALRRVAGELEQGAVSGIIEGDQASYLVRAEEVRVAETVSFEDAQDELLTRIKDLEFNRRMEEYAGKLEAEYLQLQGPIGRVLLDRFAEMVVEEVVARHYRKPGS